MSVLDIERGFSSDVYRVLEHLSLNRGYPDRYEKLIVNPVNGYPLHHLHEKLMAPFKNVNDFSLDLKSFQVTELASNSLVRQQARDLVNYAYNSNFGSTSGEVIDIAVDQFDARPGTHTLVATIDVEELPVVIGTFRVVCGDDLDIFNLFELENGIPWPHKPNGVTHKPGEVGRFAVHPLLSVLKMADNREVRSAVKRAKLEIPRLLYPHVIRHMREEGVEIPYAILIPGGRDYFVEAGLIPTLIGEAHYSNSTYAQAIRAAFVNYWKFEPMIYTAPWEVSPI